MIPPHRRCACIWLVAVAVCLPTAVVAEEGAPEQQDGGLDLPEGLQIEWQGALEQTSDGGARFTGPVTISWRESRIQADSLTLRDRRYIEAEGNVLIVWGHNRVFGTRIRYDLEEERGVIENAIGYALDDYLIWADKIEKIGPRKLHLTHATITTCSQPLPYWSFAVSSATVTLERYARMWNVRLRALKVPFIYLPYLVWPVKEDRAAGLLMPELSTTNQRGDVISVPLFVPLGRSADVTLVGRQYSEAGLMLGADVRFIPNVKGAGEFSGYHIDDSVSGNERYRVDYAQTQEFRNGFRMVADMNLVSDDKYYTDFERDLNVASSPQSLARLEFSRNGKRSSVNVRELRREQLSSGLVQSTYPEIEWRVRSSKLGRSPLYLSVESSAGWIQQDSDTLHADYLRGDVDPELSLPYSPTAWFDLTPRVAYRWSYWTQHRTAAGGLQDDPLTRQLWSYGVELVGPKVYRIFGKSGGRSRYKHTIEPRISYGFDEEFDRAGEVLPYDEIDQVRGSGKRATYAIVQRLFAKRKPTPPEPPPANPDSIVLPDGTTLQSHAEEAAEPGTKPPAVPVEIASLTLQQARSFDGDLSFADLDGDGINESTSPYSAVSLTGRFNPGPMASFDLRSNYHILFHKIEDVSLSGTLSNRLSSIRFSLFRRNGLGVEPSTLEPKPDSTQVQFTGGLSLLDQRLNLRLRTSYNAEPAPGDSHFPEQQWQFLYHTQCCTFLIERLTRDFGSLDTRRELYFRVDLRGVGKLVQKTF